MKDKRWRLFVDMDGTTAVWKVIKEFEDLYKRNWFYSMLPQPNVVDAVKYIVATKAETVDVYILSAVLPDSVYAKQEKNEWLDKYLPEIDAAHRIFTDNGKPKADFVPGGVRPTDTLLDDYTVNLTAWPVYAKAIKLMNGINGTNGTWQGARVCGNKDSIVLAETILSLMGVQ